MFDHILLNPCPPSHSAHGLKEMPGPWQLLEGAAVQGLASASAAHAGATWQHSGMLGALQIHAADREWERDPQHFPLPQMTEQVLGDGVWVGTAAYRGAAWQQLGLPLGSHQPVSGSAKQPHIACEAEMVSLGAGPSFCSSCLRSTSQRKPAHSP